LLKSNGFLATLIPEAIAFSIIAGVNPKVGLYEKISIG
jgi:MFS superfamily sulfate permease-like transporter